MKFKKNDVMNLLLVFQEGIYEQVVYYKVDGRDLRVVVEGGVRVEIYYTQELKVSMKNKKEQLLLIQGVFSIY